MIAENGFFSCLLDGQSDKGMIGYVCGKGEVLTKTNEKSRRGREPLQQSAVVRGTPYMRIRPSFIMRRNL